jgi:MoxR-like ATPase
LRLDTNPADLARRVGANVENVMVGKGQVIELLLVALASRGHVLLEDVPGTGKTVMAKSLARSLDCGFRRIQFTPDLLPTDVTGVSFYNQRAGEFEFRAGPLFAQVILADEINRATPRTQSALLEAMEERQVTVDGVTRRLSEPFMVLATQNPVEQEGTFPLPEAQLDRFLLKLPAGYPDEQEEVTILERFRVEDPLSELSPVASAEEILHLQAAVRPVHVSDLVAHYIVGIVRATRTMPGVELGASPRASLALLRAAQALALLRGRDYVMPDDVQHLAVPVLAHRLIVSTQARLRGEGGREAVQRAVAAAVVPAEPLEGR